MGREGAEATCQVPDSQGLFSLPNSEANEVGGVGWDGDLHPFIRSSFCPVVD